MHIPGIPFRILSITDLEDFYGDKDVDITVSTKKKKMIITSKSNGRRTVPLERRGRHTFLKTVDCTKRRFYVSGQPNASINNEKNM